MTELMAAPYTVAERRKGETVRGGSSPRRQVEEGGEAELVAQWRRWGSGAGCGAGTSTMDLGADRWGHSTVLAMV
jgi:hypothetical protein